MSRNIMVQVFRLLSESFIYDLNGKPSYELKESSPGFIVKIYDSMQSLHKTALVLIMIYLVAVSYIKYRKGFFELPIEERAELIKEWQGSIFSFKRDFMKFIFLLTLLSYYDNKEIMKSLNIDRAAYLNSLSFYR